MKKHRIFLLLSLGALILFFMKSQMVGANSPLPGSEDDPLVTRSYVEDMMTFKVVEVPQGKEIICGGGTEIILRAGKALAIDSSMGGLSDVTSGEDLRSGREIMGNHLLIVPRDDGRGLKASGDIIVMVRGPYYIK